MEVISLGGHGESDSKDIICTCVYREDIEDIKIVARYSAMGTLKHTDSVWAEVPSEIKDRLNHMAEVIIGIRRAVPIA